MAVFETSIFPYDQNYISDIENKSWDEWEEEETLAFFNSTPLLLIYVCNEYEIPTCDIHIIERNIRIQDIVVI